MTLVLFREASWFNFTYTALEQFHAYSQKSSLFSQDSELKRTVDESERIKRAYGHYFDLCIVNDGHEAAFRSLRSALEKLTTEQQWVPVSWVFWKELNRKVEGPPSQMAGGQSNICSPRRWSPWKRCWIGAKCHDQPGVEPFTPTLAFLLIYLSELE